MYFGFLTLCGDRDSSPEGLVFVKLSNQRENGMQKKRKEKEKRYLLTLIWKENE